MKTRQARCYAQVFAKEARDPQTLERLIHDLEKVSHVCSIYPDLHGALANPRIPGVRRQALAKRLTDSLDMSLLARCTVSVLVQQRHLPLLPLVLTALRTQMDRRNGVIQVEVLTTVPLQPAFYARLQHILEAHLDRKIHLTRREDPTLLGGVVTRIGDTVYDGSLLAQIARLQATPSFLPPRSPSLRST